MGDWYNHFAISAPPIQPAGSTCVRGQFKERGKLDGKNRFSAFYQVTQPYGTFTDFCGVAWQRNPYKR